MKIRKEDISILKSFGYTEREAGFLYLVAIHSGYFTQCQFGEFRSIKPGGIVTAFTNKLVARGHASEHRYQNNAHVFHFNYKGMYSAIDREDLRNRRAHTFEYMKSRLAVLDFVLGHLEPDSKERLRRSSTLRKSFKFNERACQDAPIAEQTRNLTRFGIS